MITILTTTKHSTKVKDIINGIDRLNELVLVTTNEPDSANSKIIQIKGNSIHLPLDWYDTEPPYIIPPVDFSDKNLLAIVFLKLGNHQKAFEFVTENGSLYHHLYIITNLIYGYPISDNQIIFLEKTSLHNLAIVYNFGNTKPVMEDNLLYNIYNDAIHNAIDERIKLFTIKHYVNFLLDSNLTAEAIKLINSALKLCKSEEEKNSFNEQLAATLMRKLSIPYSKSELEKILALQQQCISHYEEKNLKIKAGLLLIDASKVAGFQKDFIRAKEYINKAILYFKEEGIPELLGEATLQKAILLYTWSKNGNPQYYKPAINAFQNALKVFKRDTHPQKFADIHHHLALIYSEIQIAENEKPIWTAFCASSFKEALSFYKKEKFPYEYAMIAHNYATALMGFPEAKLHNNLEKSFDLFEEALSIRTPEKYPFERALTLLNQLELYWLLHNESPNEEIKKYNEMKNKALEIKDLVKDETLITKANEQLNALNQLKTFIN